MATSRLHIACALLLAGVVLLGTNQEGMEAVACPQYCLEVDYITCPSSGSQKLPARCNCCMAPKGSNNLVQSSECVRTISDGSTKLALNLVQSSDSDVTSCLHVWCGARQCTCQGSNNLNKL
ncbi:hypothetical protein ACQJBY_041613 [Aegilops geniculata]